MKGPYAKLFALSFLSLALEILLIRLIGSEIRLFAYFKNLVLIACFLGLGLGCATKNTSDTNRTKYALAFIACLTVLIGILATAQTSGIANISFLFDKNAFDWNDGVASAFQLSVNCGLVCGIFLLVAATFDFLGRLLAEPLAELPPLIGYALNIGGSLCGVIVFSAASFFSLPPFWWLAACLAPLVPLFLPSRQTRIPFAIASLLILGSSLLFANGTTIWSPYYRIDTAPLHYWLKDKNKLITDDTLGTIVNVNHHQHQRTFNLSSDFLHSHPFLLGSNELRTYNMPYVAKPAPADVLIVGAGTGNDVAAALRNGAGHVDAVEIDPMILKLGRGIHPEHPFDDPRVTVHISDARNFLALTDKKYDLIVFGHLDSQTALSTMSSVRLDNYLYTKESIASATAHLKDTGVACLSFATQPNWLRARLYQMVNNASTTEPLALNTEFDSPNSILLFWGPGFDNVRQNVIDKFPALVADKQPLLEPVEIPSDDWPFLYQRDRSLPMVSLLVLTIVVGISGLLIQSRFRLRRSELIGNLQFFLLGAGFLLLETREMLAVAILFGSTWVVNSVVIGIVLIMALLANWVVARFKPANENWTYAGLLLAIAVLYLVPLSSLCAANLVLKLVGSALLLGAPFFFSGLVFSSAFAKSKTPQVALGVNILGAILGGCLEYLCVALGIHALTLLALGVYLAAWISTRMKAVRIAETGTAISC